jgi:DNA-binding NarL/FixJ family response regulator
MTLQASNEMIATSLGISVRTVHAHVASLLRKIQCENRTQAVVSAIRESLLVPDHTTIVDLARWALH